MQRVNKITASLVCDNEVIITLYRTHNKLGTVTHRDIGVPHILETKVTNRNAYLEYCKEVTIALLQNDGIPGYYYEVTNTGDSDKSTNNSPRKYDKSTFLSVARQCVQDTLNSFNIEHSISESDKYSDVIVTETYKDGHVKYAHVQIHVKIMDKPIMIPIHLKSGQLCKPKTFLLDATEYALHVTNINKVVHRNE